MLLLLACTGGDSADTAKVTPPAPPPSVSVRDAAVRFVGRSNDSAGNALALDDGMVVIGAQLGNRACGWTTFAAGANPLDAAPSCWTGASPSDYAGASVDVRGASVLIGAIGQSDAAANAGAALLVTDLAAPSLADALALTGEAAGDYAGTRVLLPGDLDGDGVDDLLVGAPGNDRGGAGAGAVYLVPGPFTAGSLTAAATIWVGTGLAPAGPPAAVPPPHGPPSEGDGVGAVFAPAGDLDGDGLVDLVLGANGNDAGGADAGAVGIALAPFPAGQVAWADLDQRWIGAAPSTFAGDEVLGALDLDGDGHDDLLSVEQGAGPGVLRLIPGPGAPGDHSLADSPAALSGVATGDQAGASVARAGDLDGDGAPDLVVGAYEFDTPTADAGAACLILGPLPSGTTSLADADLTWLGDQDGAWVGRAVAGGADLDGDGAPELLIGSPYDAEGGVFAGAAWLWTGAETRARLAD